MRGHILGLVALFSVVGSTAIAQPPTPTGAAQRPTFSPYLNFLNRNFSPAGNYFGFVRPQQQMQSQFNQLNSNLNRANQTIQGLQSQADQLTDQNGYLPSTANIPTFMNTGHYFSYNPALMGGMGGRGSMGRAMGMGPMGANNQIPQMGSLPGGGSAGANRNPSRGGGVGGVGGIGGGVGGIRR